MKEAARQRLDTIDIAGLTLGGIPVTDLVTLDGYKFVMADGGWLLVRFSGTEPIIRVYCETTDESKVKPLLEEGLRLAGLA
jgi:phosphomannomutase